VFELCFVIECLSCCLIVLIFFFSSNKQHSFSPHDARSHDSGKRDANAKCRGRLGVESVAANSLQIKRRFLLFVCFLW
jgi:hypothetical protein